MVYSFKSECAICGRVRVLRSTVCSGCKKKYLLGMKVFLYGEVWVLDPITWQWSLEHRQSRDEYISSLITVQVI